MRVFIEFENYAKPSLVLLAMREPHNEQLEYLSDNELIEVLALAKVCAEYKLNPMCEKEYQEAKENAICMLSEGLNDGIYDRAVVSDYVACLEEELYGSSFFSCPDKKHAKRDDSITSEERESEEEKEYYLSNSAPGQNEHPLT